MTDQQTPAELEADIERQRDELARTVDRLTEKLDVKAQARQRAARAVDRATTDDGAPRPEVIATVAGGVIAAVLLGIMVWWRHR